MSERMKIWIIVAFAMVLLLQSIRILIIENDMNEIRKTAVGASLAVERIRAALYLERSEKEIRK